uniref:ATP synthase complex subunit 8 n=1 Tax=Schistodesmus lampreyanus TaxID=165458 RepID=A0A4D5YF58_9BIVA|nr:ATP synthase F0 subunit 8 [Schistodesmus lampreyanus]QBS54496.1 ATP synthase F0 subunit 8 [Schistodesmus lampreyanus]
MPQLSPMSWILVIVIFLVCLIFFAVMIWWVVESKYVVKYMGDSNKVVGLKKTMKWGFGSVMLK